MNLCIDIGNSTIFCGIGDEIKIHYRFRHDCQSPFTSDQFGLFLIGFLQENNIPRGSIKKIAICSVVPQLDYSVISACIKYVKIHPFVLKPGVKTKLKIKYRDPLEAGADRIADAMAACHHYPNKDIIVINFGTATTFTVINAQKDYLGGLIVPGLRLSMNALENFTALISPVEIVFSNSVVGRSTKECVQNGLYFGHLSMIEGITQRIKHEVFNSKECVIIGTGGFSHLFAKAPLFTIIEPDLVLLGLLLSLKLNMSAEVTTENPVISS